jgi:hypothetical protein
MDRKSEDGPLTEDEEKPLDARVAQERAFQEQAWKLDHRKAHQGGALHRLPLVALALASAPHLG